jgi:hypothetical protein
MKWFGFALIATFVFGSVAVAQGGGPPGPGRGGPGSRMFDPATVTTVSGSVEAVDRVEGRRGGPGVHLRLKTGDGILDVHLGPAWFLDRQELKIAKDDAIEVTGSKVQFRGKAALVAQTVKKGDASLTLRDASGVPVWAGFRRN